MLDGSVCPPVTSLACNDDSCAFLSKVTACLTAGAPYYIRVAGYGGSSGNFYLKVTAAAPATLPNDDCTGAIALGTGANGPFSNVGAADSCVAASCGAGASPGYKDVWFSYVPTCTGNLTIDTGCGGGNLDTILTVYGSCGGAELACNDDAPGGTCGLSSSRDVPRDGRHALPDPGCLVEHDDDGQLPGQRPPGRRNGPDFQLAVRQRLDPDQHVGWSPGSAATSSP